MTLGSEDTLEELAHWTGESLDDLRHWQGLGLLPDGPDEVEVPDVEGFTVADRGLLGRDVERAVDALAEERAEVFVGAGLDGSGDGVREHARPRCGTLHRYPNGAQIDHPRAPRAGRP